MSYLSRTLKNIRKAGIKDAWHQLNYMGDTKAQTASALVGVDKFGNKFYENLQDELPLRTRWVDYKSKDPDAAQVEPMWHAWIAYAVDTPPDSDPLTATAAARAWASKTHTPNLTATRAAYKPYSTTKPKVSSWVPNAAPRS